MAKKRAEGVKKKPGRPPSGKPRVGTEARVTPRFLIRLPEEYKAALQAMADKNFRSISAEILLAIKERIDREAGAAGS